MLLWGLRPQTARPRCPLETWTSIPLATTFTGDQGSGPPAAATLTPSGQLHLQLAPKKAFRLVSTQPLPGQIHSCLIPWDCYLGLTWLLPQRLSRSKPSPLVTFRGHGIHYVPCFQLPNLWIILPCSWETQMSSPCSRCCSVPSPFPSPVTVTQGEVIALEACSCPISAFSDKSN